jgi:L-arabinokinase
VDAARLERAGLGYIELVAASDVVVTKPGYGIVSDCVGAGTRLVYTERGDFPEYDVMVAEMPRWLACEPVDNEGLFAGRLKGALERVLARPQPPAPDVGGAERAAQRLAARLAAS